MVLHARRTQTRFLASRLHSQEDTHTHACILCQMGDTREAWSCVLAERYTARHGCVACHTDTKAVCLVRRVHSLNRFYDLPMNFAPPALCQGFARSLIDWTGAMVIFAAIKHA